MYEPMRRNIVAQLLDEGSSPRRRSPTRPAALGALLRWHIDFAPKLNQRSSPRGSPAAFEAGTGRHGAIMIGSAGEITDKLLDAAKALDLDRIFAQVDWGGLPPDLVGESIARYATEIAPALRL